MLAVVFPGQGSQEVGMASDFAARFPESRAALAEADEAFGGPLSSWLRDGPEERLRRTEVTQPAILAASIAIWRAVEPRLARPPALLAGHSLGEYTALVAGGGLDLAEAVRLVRRRGQLMAEAVPEGQGAMVAVLGLEGEEVARVCAEIPGQVAPANYNSDVQTVIAGEKRAVELAGEALRAAGAKRLIPLAVSAPFHCALMAPAQEKLAPALGEACFRDLRIPVVSNVTAEPYRGGAEARELLVRQVTAPVRWVETVAAFGAAGVRVHLEVGPGHVLTGLAGRLDRSLRRPHIATVEQLEPALAEVAGALA
jgi:[acyl-carrier-protein] S-malonyltransferase